MPEIYHFDKRWRVALVEDLGDTDLLWGSMVKQAIKRRHPGFNERFHGFRSFNALLEEIEKQGLISLKPDDRSGGYVIRGSNGNGR